jgi:hypothetical protein
MLRLTTLFTALQLFFLSVAAQVPSIKVTGGADSSVSLKILKIEINVTGNIANTSMEMTFHNSNSRILEGTLTFPLPQGITVSGYALDINGKLRDAVPVEKEKATQVFESIERRKVDPGLLEKVEGNNFRTRIYPLPAGGNRTVRISYDEILQPGLVNTLRYNLPLVYAHAIPDFHLAIHIMQASIPPVLEEQPGNLLFKEWNKNYSATADKKDFIPTGSLRFAIPKDPDIPEVVMQKVNHDYFFLANAVINQPASRKRKPGTKVGIIWDASISGLKRNIAAELELLNKYFEKNPDCTVELATLRNIFEKKGSFQVLNGNWNNLKKELESVIYDGATDYSAMNLLSVPCSEYLLFSDGMSTFGANRFPLPNKPVFTINSSLQADYNTLQLIARNSGAEFINLTVQSVNDALKSLTEEPFKFIRIKNAEHVSEVYPSFPVTISNGHFSIAGQSDSPVENITLQFGYGNTVTMEKVIRLNYSRQQTTQINLQRFWATLKIAELDLQYEKYKNDISSLGRQFSIVTRNTSLMVLETVEDYVRYKIEPPAELRKQYYTILKESRNEGMEEEMRKYDILTSFKNLFEWWKPVSQKIASNFTPTQVSEDTRANAVNNNRLPVVNSPVLEEVVVTAFGQQRQAKELGYSVTRVQSAELTQLQTVSLQNGLAGKIAGVNIVNSNLQEVVVTGYPLTYKVPDPSIIVADWSPDRPYLVAVEQEAPANYYKKYIELRKDFVSTPTFYFDMAGFFFRKKDKATAIRVLSNIAELNIEDHELYTMLGFKLKEAGDYTKALFIFKKVLDWRPHEPQSYRHYALALADAGQWQQAADTLYAGLNKEYSGNNIDNYQGIQDVMIMELNNLLAKHKDRIKPGSYNKKIIAVMPVDIRVVLNWNRNNTDIDLWVTDPKGEKCFFGNSKTTNGALISNDMTEGYGPEQLMVRKALKGKYKIQVHYYGDDQVTLTGPSTIMVEIFTRYNSGKEVRKIITMQMENEKANDGIFVGEFNFE